MKRTSSVNRSVHRKWKRSAYELLTGSPQGMDALFTGLLTAASAAEQAMTARTQALIVKGQMEDLWAAARLGFAGVSRFTVGKVQRVERYLLKAAFECGTKLRAHHKAAFRAPEHLAAAGARSEGPTELRDELKRLRMAAQ